MFMFAGCWLQLGEMKNLMVKATGSIEFEPA